MPSPVELICAVCLLCAAAAAADEPALRPPYPLRASQVTRTSEVPFVETAETLRYGFNVPFPECERAVFRVDDFGGRPDGQTDCTPAFYHAIAAATESGRPAEIVFERGRYLFRPDRALGSDDLAILNVSGASDLLIRGRGHDTVLLMADPALGGVHVSESNVVMVRDLAIDYDPLPFTQGEVMDVNDGAGEFLLRLDPGYPTPAALNAAIPGRHGGFPVVTAQDGAYRWLPIGGVSVDRVEPATDGDWRFCVPPGSVKGCVRETDQFVYVGRRIAQMALGASDTRGFYVQHVAVHASPTCGLGLMNVDGVCVDGYADTIPLLSGRLLASNADGIFVHGARGGITIKNCTFMGQGDDCINLHCPAFSVRYVTVHSDTEITISGPVNVRAGDILEVMDPHIGRIKGQVTILWAERAADRQSVRCQLGSPLSAVGYAAETDRVYPVSLSASNFKIVRNYMGQNRSRCMLIQARDGLIAANTIENAEGYGVCMGYGGTAWAEGVIPSRVTVRDNIFRNVTGVGLAGAIELVDGSDFRNFRDITIAGNQFVNTRKMAICATGCVGLKITGNTVSTENGRRNTWNHPQWYPLDCSVYLKNCTDVEVSRLSLTDPSVTQAGVYIDKTCGAGEDGVKVGEITASIPDGIPSVLDAR